MKTAATNTLAVQLYDGRTPVPVLATLMWLGGAVKIIGATITLDYPVDRLSVSPRIGSANRFISLPDGAQLQCPDDPLLDRLPQEDRSEGAVAWLEQRWHVALVCVALTIGSVTAAYLYGLPAAAQHIAAHVPMEHELALGQHALGWLDERKLFEPSTVEIERQQEISAGFRQLTHDLPMAPHYRLEFRAAPMFGANAVALPGAIIVITDDMIDLSESKEEVLAVLAHEIGHVERRHVLRHVLQDSATAALAAGLTSDVASLSLAISGLPALLAQAKYSRIFETEADDFAFELLRRHDLSPEHFATLMERLGQDTSEADSAEEAWSFISTHPVTRERIARARAAAREDKSNR